MPVDRPVVPTCPPAAAAGTCSRCRRLGRAPSRSTSPAPRAPIHPSQPPTSQNGGTCYALNATRAVCQCVNSWSGSDCGSCPSGFTCGPGGYYFSAPARLGSAPAIGAAGVPAAWASAGPAAAAQEGAAEPAGAATAPKGGPSEALPGKERTLDGSTAAFSALARLREASAAAKTTAAAPAPGAGFGARAGEASAAALPAKEQWDLLTRVLDRLCDGDMGFTYIKQGERGALGFRGRVGGRNQRGTWTLCGPARDPAGVRSITSLLVAHAGGGGAEVISGPGTKITPPGLFTRAYCE
jgi:hypothetical protein